MVIIIIALFGALILNSNKVSADQSELAVTENRTAENSENYDGFADSALPSLFKVVGALLVVVLAIYAGLFLLKRMMGKKYSGNRKNNIMEVLETTYIGPKKSISLIKVADKSVLIASTETNISLLTEMDSAATNEILSQISVEEESDQFKNLFKTATEKIKEISAIGRDSKSLDVQPTVES